MKKDPAYSYLLSTAAAFGSAAPGGQLQAEHDRLPVVSVGALNPDLRSIALFSNAGDGRVAYVSREDCERCADVLKEMLAGVTA